MGFDKIGQQPFRIPVSDTQAYRQFGNAVAVPVVEAIAKHMIPWLDRNDIQVSRTRPRQMVLLEKLQ